MAPDRLKKKLKKLFLSEASLALALQRISMRCSSWQGYSNTRC